MSFRAPIGTNAFRQALRRREDSTPRDHRVVHEASRLVFCVLLGIPVKEIRISDASIQVHYDTDGALSSHQVLDNSIQMIMSGVITVQTVLGQENHLFEPALAEAQMLYGRSSRIHDEFANDFDGLLSICSQAAIANLANPKIREAIYSVIRILNRERNDLRGEMLIRLLMNVRSKLSA